MHESAGGVGAVNPGPLGPPRGIRETKNNQLFEKYMNRHNRKQSQEVVVGGGGQSNVNSTTSGVHPPPPISDYHYQGSHQQPNISNGIPASSSFALPTLPKSVVQTTSLKQPQSSLMSNQVDMGPPPAISQMSGRNKNNGNGHNPSGFSSRNKRSEPTVARQSISDDEFDL